MKQSKRKQLIANNLKDFIAIIVELNSENKSFHTSSVNKLTFYRGQADENWNLVPRLYRESLLSKEGVLIGELERRMPQEFQNLGRFESLIKMQHYGLPTRLLDATLNPLVALFFACSDLRYQECNGNVFYFPGLPVFHYHNTFVNIVLKYVFEYSGFKLYADQFYEDVISDKSLQSVHTVKPITKDDALRPLFNIKQMAILPPLNNPRILNQDGTFFLFGMDLEEVETSKNPGTYGRNYYKFKGAEFDTLEKFWPHSRNIRIPADAKEQILEELNLIGITKSKLFPELNNQAEFVTEILKREI